MVGAAAGQVLERGAKLAMAVAEACNPLKTIFNGGTLSDIMEATAELSKAISLQIKTDAFLQAWEGLTDETERIAKGFQKIKIFFSLYEICYQKGNKSKQKRNLKRAKLDFFNHTVIIVQK